MDASSFATAAASMPSVKVTHMSEDDISARATNINQHAIFEAAPAVQNIRKMHCFCFVDGQLRMSQISRELDITSEVPSPAIGQFVTTVYDGNIYIAQVESINGTHVELSFMRPHGMAKCNWPRRPDVLPLPRFDILASVDPPAPLSSMSRFVGLSADDKRISMTRFKIWKNANKC